MVRTLNEEFVPVRVLSSENPEIGRRFSLTWTPTLVVLHHRGATLRQWVGFLPPEDFLAELTLTLALNELRNARPTEASQRLEAIVDHPTAGPEALFWKGVAAYRHTGQKPPLWEVWREIPKRYPDSRWARHTTLLQPDWEELPELPPSQD